MTQAFNLSQLANNLNTAGQLDATDGLTGAVPVANGGTGASTITANAVVLGNGTSSIQTVSPSTSGNVLTSNGTTWISQAPASPTIADGSVTDPKIANGIVNGTTWYPIMSASGGFSSGEGAGGTWRNACQFRMYRGGTFQLRGRVSNGNPDFSQGIGFRVLVNGSVVATSNIVYPSPGANATASVGSFSVSRGDVVQIQNYADSSNSQAVSGNFQLGTNNNTYSIPFATEVVGNGAGGTGNFSYLPI